jgi:hypothetical protein
VRFRAPLSGVKSDETATQDEEENIASSGRPASKAEVQKV